MALQVPSGPYGAPQQPKQEEPMHDGQVSYKHLDSSNISHREIALLREQIWKMRHPNSAERERLWPSDLQPKVTELKDIATQRLYQWESDTTWFRAYEVELHQFTGYSFINLCEYAYKQQTKKRLPICIGFYGNNQSRNSRNIWGEWQQS